MICINTLRPKLNGCHNVSKCIIVYEKFSILIKISQRFVTKGPVDNVVIGSANGLASDKWQAIT